MTSKALEPAILSGCDSSIPAISDESDDSNYKLFKQQNRKIFARFVGTNCRSGSPKKQIWVKKCIIENLSVTANLNIQSHSLRDNNYHSQNGSGKFLNGYRSNFRRKEYMCTYSNHYTHVSGNNFNGYSYDYSRSAHVSHRSRRKSAAAQTNNMRSLLPTQVWVAKNN